MSDDTHFCFQYRLLYVKHFIKFLVKIEKTVATENFLNEKKILLGQHQKQILSFRSKDKEQFALQLSTEQEKTLEVTKSLEEQRIIASQGVSAFWKWLVRNFSLLWTTLFLVLVDL